MSLKTLLPHAVSKDAVRRQRAGVRKKYEARAIFRSMAFMMLVVGYFVYATFLTGDDTGAVDQEAMQMQRHLTNSTGCDLSVAEPGWTLILYILGVLYMFVALAIVCDEFFVPALEEMSNEDHMNLSMDVAGATLMAAGGSAPELFTSMIGTFQESDVGFGTIVGSAVFNVLFVIGMCAMFSKEVLTLTWWPLFRDCSYYILDLFTLYAFFAFSSPGEIHWHEAVILFAEYFGYVLLMAYNQDLYIWLMKMSGKEIPEGKDANGDSNVSFTKPSTFRAGMLKLLMKDGSMADTAGVGIVSKLTGNVSEVFKQIDESGNGLIDSNELAKLFEMLECPVGDTELTTAMKELDENGDGQIDFSEFTKWYIRSETRIKAQTKTAFKKCDENDSGTIEKTELKKLLNSMGDKPTNSDIEEALKEMFQSGNPNEITFDEFDSWYSNSLFWTEHKKEADEAADVAEGVWTPFPANDGPIAILKWLIFVPLIGTLCLTVPDVRQPGKQKWCYVAFFLSICWIGVYSFFMVMWAEIIGNTLSIPTVVMGVTFLAAGTSVPDLLSSIIGNTLSIPTVVMGVTFLAAGTSVPDLLSSVIVARMGEGDMAVSSSIGRYEVARSEATSCWEFDSYCHNESDNIFDILVGLPFPWLVYIAYLHTGDHKIADDGSVRRYVLVGADGIDLDILILLLMLCAIVTIIHFSGWKMTKTLGGCMFGLYFGFVLQSVGRKLPFTMC
ncbi:hypothetical protein TL16_g11936 [Triparma laevis f. inornata]|uniref:EF-hand domain-containing protein n=1 Tax=Triparma laevis f. inornata TaxID=1714386 RepID=A0A9W7BID3_9STRA|nr:hypothetical protein TL16_g11936 [Triparma laevis f. inornata]